MKASEARKIAEDALDPAARKELNDILNIIKLTSEQGKFYFIYVPETTHPDVVYSLNVVDYALKSLEALGYRVKPIVVSNKTSYTVSWY